MQHLKQFSIVLLLAVFMASGCKTQDAAGRALCSAVLTVDGSMKGWGAWVRAGQATAGDEVKVRDAYAKYQAAELVAESAYVTWKKTGDKSPWVKALTVLQADAANIAALVETFTTKTNTTIK